MDDPEFLRQLLERALQRILEAEMTAHLNAARYERSEGRQGYRNSYKPRQLHTRVGTLALRVPRTARGPAQPSSSRATSAARKPSS
jgi:putative transposase